MKFFQSPKKVNLITFLKLSRPTKFKNSVAYMLQHTITDLWLSCASMTGFLLDSFGFTQETASISEMWLLLSKEETHLSCQPAKIPSRSGPGNRFYVHLRPIVAES